MRMAWPLLRVALFFSFSRQQMTVDLPFWSRALPRMGLVRFRMSASIVSKYVAHTQVPVSNLWSGAVLTRTSPEVEFSDAAV